MSDYEYIDGDRATLDPSDRGLAYGDGLFETMLAESGRIRWLHFHLDRLLEGCRRLRLPAPATNELTERLLARIEGGQRTLLKLILTRGSGPRGYAPPAAPRCRVILFASTPPSAQELTVPVEAAVLNLRLSEQDNLAGLKHLCRIEQVLARLELRERNFDEGILLNRSGYVVGCSSANLFVVAGDRLLTPAISTSGIAGVTRRAVLEAGAASGIRIEEATMTQAHLASADEMFLTNAVVGVRAIASLDGRTLPGTGWAERVRALLEARVNNA